MGVTGGNDSLERNVPLLASLDDPRAHARLKRILSQLAPFDTVGFPEKKAGFEAYLTGWFFYHLSGLRWDREADRYRLESK